MIALLPLGVRYGNLISGSRRQTILHKAATLLEVS